MINNRQGGRRRGRGGQRPPSIGGQSGNRSDNRQRGNAAQLLEKYKNMARDAQLGGDRVQSEYYLQFADHYFRVLGEGRSRFEDQQRQRGDDGSDEDGHDDMMDAGEEQQREPRGQQREPREQQRETREPRESQQREPRPQREPRARRSESRSNGSQPDYDNDDEERISLAVLPPSIGRDDFDGDDAEEPVAKPKRRVRRAKAEDSEDDIAPAA